MKKNIRIITVTVLSVFLLYCIGFFIAYPETPTYNDCGIVMSKSNDEVSIKHGVRTELYLNIQFEKTGFKSVLVEPTTYFKLEKGNRTCFDLNVNVNLWYRLRWICGVITLLSVSMIAVVSFGLYLFY